MSLPKKHNHALELIEEEIIKENIKTRRVEKVKKTFVGVLVSACVLKLFTL